MKVFCCLFLFVMMLLASCTKRTFNEEPTSVLELGSDTLTFDTVFTTIGSTTKRFTVKNPYAHYLRISNVVLAGGESSYFRININGAAVLETSDYELAPGDSMYIFAEVTVDPNQEALPFLIKDSVLFTTNGNQQKVLLVAYGQNAHYFNSEVIGDTVFSNDKPYLIYNSILVDSGKTLYIEPGCRLYFHKNSRLYIQGTLIAAGTVEEPIIFTNDRLESSYREIAGQWDGLHFLKGGHESYLGHCIIENSVVGVRVDSLPELGDGILEYNTRPALYDSFTVIPNVLIENTTIRNISASGILGLTAAIEGKNMLVYNCGQNNVQLEFGGYYDFDFCTFANYPTNASVQHRKPILRFGNYFESSEGVQVSAVANASFSHTIIHGSLDDEIELDSINIEGADFTYSFDYSLIKYKDQIFDSTKFSNVFEGIPSFENYMEDNYRLDSSSQLINAGNKSQTNDVIQSGLEFDLDGFTRMSGTSSDIGAFERQQ